MSSSESSKSIPFKSKKLLVNSTLKSQPKNPNPLLISKTPEKSSAELPSRARNRGVALSLKEVRSAAQVPSQHPTDKIISARKQILSWPTESPLPKPKNAAEGSMKLPEKYEMLGQFFDGLDSTIRLSKLRGSMSTFTNISPQIERLTDRRFSLCHLAQMKYILPEAIETKRILIFDERTSCPKPDLHVTLNVDAIQDYENLKLESKNMGLRKLFRARLADFHKAHPEGDEIPEEILPEPFNHSKHNQCSNFKKASFSSSQNESSTGAPTDQQQSLSVSCIEGDEICEVTQPESLAVETSVTAVKKQQPAVASHLSRSFRKHFYPKVSYIEEDKMDKKSSKVSLQNSLLPVPEGCLNKSSSAEETSSASALSPAKLSLKPTCSEKCLSYCASPAKLLSTCSHATPIKERDSMKNKDSSPTKFHSIQSTPVKLASTPAKLASTPTLLMSATPSLKQQKRCYTSPDDVSTSSPNKLIRRPRRARSLKYDIPVEDEKAEDGIDEKVEDEANGIEGRSIDDDILDILPESLLQSIREKERKAMEERDPAISQAKRRRQMIACLPKLFNTIHFLFQSIRRSVITKEELIHKLIAGHCDIVDRREVEEQLNLLRELVPEWISEMLSRAGDLLICINKMSSPESIRARLEEAK